MSTEATDLLVVIATVAVGFLFAVVFYESLCDRDVYVRRPMRVARRVSRRRPVIFLTYLVSVGVGIPLMVAIWTFLLTLALFVVGSLDRVASTAFVAAAVIGATRLLAYLRSKTAHELAKAIPLSLAFLLITGGSLNLTEKLAVLDETLAGLNITDEMLGLLIGMEVALRLTTDATHGILSWVRNRRGVDGGAGAGFWRSLWAGVRQPASPVTAAMDEVRVID